jgi:PAS domain S-box-containing protein
MSPDRELSRTEIERQIMAEIARGVAVTDSLDELLRLIHESLRRAVYAENHFVSLYDPKQETITFPYFVDEVDEAPGPLPRGRTCTDYVLRTGKPLLLTNDLFEELEARGEVELIGAPSPSWMGVPLTTPTATIGVMAMQHYVDEDAFSQRDLELCSSVAGHIALAIERKRRDEELHESRALVTNIVESMSDGVVVLDRDTSVIYWSREMDEISRASRNDIVGSGRKLWDHFPHLKENGVDQMILRAMKGETARGLELPFRLENGTEGFTNEVYLPLRRRTGEIYGVLGVVRDVTERIQSEEELRAKKAQLQHAQKMEAVGRLAGGIAHDFNNLLTVINGHTEIMLSQLAEASPLRESVEAVRDSGHRAAVLTQKLLALSRKQMVELNEMELSEQVQGFQSVLRRLIPEHIEFVTDVFPEPLPTMLDQGQLEQIILNLVVNACDAMPGGGRLTVRTLRRELTESSASHSVSPGTYVGLEVEDSGIGMDGQTLQHIFEPFFTTKEVEKRTGLGLAIVYGIVKQNGGYVWAESEPQQGTKFQVFFPMNSPEAGELRERETKLPPVRGSETILVVEDEPAVRSLVARILVDHGYAVIEADGGAAALEADERFDGSVDMLITDVVMPRMSGPQLAEQLKRRIPDLPVLFISGHLGETVESQGLLHGADLLAKPFSAEQLAGEVRRVLCKRPDSQR